MKTPLTNAQHPAGSFEPSQHGLIRLPGPADPGRIARYALQPPADRTAHQRLMPTRMVAASAEPDESLVADPRARLTPSQIVDQRLLALLGGGNLGLYLQASGRPGDVRKRPGR